MPLHLRPREKLKDKGVENIRNKELLAILLRTGKSGKSALDIANLLLKKFTLNALINTKLDELISVPGIDSTKACTLLAAFEITKRALKLYEKNLPTIETPNQAIKHLSQIRELKKEHFLALYLNARNQLIYQETISIGTLTASLVHPREVFAPALEVRAASVLLAHNHPSENSLPSEQDIEITQRLIRVGELIGIEVMDHIIVTNKDFKSLKQLGLM